MSQPDTNNRWMKWMPIAMIACCAIPVTTALFLGGGIGAWFGRSSQQATSDRSISQSSTQPTNVDASLEKAVNWQANNHVHGLAVNPDNPQVLYVASHNGLLKRSETGEWFWMEPEKERADYMGFTAHPTDSQRFYASGHPHSGGNLGFQITENQGRNWKQISLPGVDLHAMAIAPSNPNVFYGWPASGARGLHVSTDGGKTWTQPLMAGLRAAPFSLAVDPVNPDRVFATTRLGLYQSTNSGSNWALVPNTQDAPIIGLALENQGEITVMYGYRFLKSSPGLYRSRDGGKTWEKLGNGTKGTIVYMAIAPSKPQILYAINDRNTLFQSPDGGKTWKQLV